MDIRIGSTNGISQTQANRVGQSIDGAAFAEAMLESLGVKLSAHAKARIQDRSISLSQERVAQILEGMEALSKKGVREGVLVFRDMAVVVGVPTKTVVTFKTPPFSKDGVFNQIDGVVIME
ncbi:flagellar hook associated protein [Coprothermobacteraceae bacterium]|nr:flagellar hook associated protein [Coprothermobacteraceae bacterium]